jgi:hypothetical protein
VFLYVPEVKTRSRNLLLRLGFQYHGNELMRVFLPALAGLLAIAAVAASPALAQRSIACSSDNGKRHYCEVDTRGGVSMVHQRSDTACEEGYSWDYDRRGIWVDHGCRAEFRLHAGIR